MWLDFFFLQQAMLLIFAQKPDFWLMFLNLKARNLAKGDTLFFNICEAYRYVKSNELWHKQPVILLSHFWAKLMAVDLTKHS